MNGHAENRGDETEVAPLLANIDSPQLALQLMFFCCFVHLSGIIRQLSDVGSPKPKSRQKMKTEEMFAQEFGIGA